MALCEWRWYMSLSLSETEITSFRKDKSKLYILPNWNNSLLSLNTIHSTNVNQRLKWNSNHWISSQTMTIWMLFKTDMIIKSNHQTMIITIFFFLLFLPPIFYNITQKIKKYLSFPTKTKIAYLLFSVLFRPGKVQITLFIDYAMSMFFQRKEE